MNFDTPYVPLPSYTCIKTTSYVSYYKSFEFFLSQIFLCLTKFIEKVSNIYLRYRISVIIMFVLYWKCYFILL